jgi:hypothetical protein
MTRMSVVSPPFLDTLPHLLIARVLGAMGIRPIYGEGALISAASPPRVSGSAEKEVTMFKRLVTAALLSGMAATAPPAAAMGCAPRDHIVERLKDRYLEAPTAAGLETTSETRQRMLEIWSNPENGSYTVLLTDPTGISCIVGYGSEFRVLEAPPKGELG